MTITANLVKLSEFLGAYHFEYFVDIGSHAKLYVNVNVDMTGQASVLGALTYATSQEFLKAFQSAQKSNPMPKRFTFEVI